jgi:ankyrin repeat protein
VLAAFRELETNNVNRLSHPQGVRFDLQTHTVSTRASQPSIAQSRDVDTIWYEMYQALQASDASESSLETLRTLVLERSTSYVPCVDSTPIVVTPDSTDNVLLRITNTNVRSSSSETRFSTVSSNSSGSTNRSSRGSITAALRSKKSKFIEAAQDADMDTLLSLQTRVDKEAIQKALAAVVRSEAVVPGQVDVVRFLLEIGAHIEYPDSFYRRTPLISAVVSRRSDLVVVLLERGASLDSRDGSRHNTPLIWAISTNDPTILRLLIQHGADTTVKDVASGHTPFVFAAHLGHVDTARVLLEEERRCIEERDGSGMTPLAIAYTKRNVSLATLFIQYEDDIDFVWPSSLSLLAMAIVESQTDFVRLLLHSGSTLTQIYGFPALTIAVRKHAHDTVNVLLDKILATNRSALETKDPKGGTALLWAVWLKDHKMVEILVAAGADLAVKDVTGFSVQHWANWTKNKRIVALVARQRNGCVHQVELHG